MDATNRLASRPFSPTGQARTDDPAVALTVAVTRAVVVAELVVGAVLVADRLRRRPPSPRLRVTMGPGGWVSVKGGQVGVRPAGRPWGRPRRVVETVPAAGAPWWARVLSAIPLQVLSR